MAPLMIAGSEPAPRKKQPLGVRERFDITDLILIYREVTREPRVVLKVQKTREFRAIRETAPLNRELEASGGSERYEQASDCTGMPQNAAVRGSSVTTAEIPQTFPQPALISLDFSSNWRDACRTNEGAP